MARFNRRLVPLAAGVWVLLLGCAVVPARAADELSDTARRAKAAQRAETISDDELWQLAQRQFLPPIRFDYDELLVLRAAKERGDSAQARAIVDERMLKGDAQWGSQLESAWLGLSKDRRANLLPALTRLYREGEPPVRRRAVGCLPSVGDAALPLVLDAIRSDDGDVRKSVMHGLRGATTDGAFGPDASKPLFDAIVEIYPRLSPGPTDDLEPACFALVRLDRDRAVAFLSDSLRWRRDDRAAFGVVTRALVAAKAVIPGDRVLAFLDSIDPLSRAARGDDFTYGFLLALLARSGHPSALARIEADMARFAPAQLGEKVWFDRWYLGSAAARAYLAVNGLSEDEVYKTAFDAARLFPPAGEGVPEPLSDFVLVRSLYTDVLNEGVGRYVRARGDEAERAIAALDRMGAPSAAGSLRIALAGYGPDATSPDPATRERAAARGGGRIIRAEKLRASILAGQDDLHALPARHAVRHKDVFRATATKVNELRARAPATAPATP